MSSKHSTITCPSCGKPVDVYPGPVNCGSCGAAIPDAHARVLVHVVARPELAPLPVPIAVQVIA